ncbi:MAG: hypothetical protein H7323_06950 [Frankiales bacterium]|nr:hypothetical protein [Frankiales bacterium]
MSGPVVTVSGGPTIGPFARSRLSSRIRRTGTAAVAVLLLAVVMTVPVRDRRDAREAAAVRLVVTAAVPVAGGRPDSPVQDALVQLTLENDGPDPVRVLSQQLDGGGPLDPGPPGPVQPGRSARLEVRWRVLCAETGSQDGPRSLGLSVRPPHGPGRTVTISLGAPLGATRRAFHTAAVDACSVLLR